MYRKNANGWLKHIDFIILDMICLQIAFVVAYFIKNGNIHLYNNFLYRNMAIILEVADLMVLLIFGTLKGVLKRGHYQEFVKTLKHSFIVCLFVGNSIFVYCSKGCFLFKIYLVFNYWYLFYIDIYSKRTMEGSYKKGRE